LEDTNQKVGISKHPPIHTLRHIVFLLIFWKAVQILRYIQELLGHKSSKTTEIYIHVSEKDIARIRSSLDTIVEKRCDDVEKKESIPIDGKK
jgi:site-specific recombinase XerD